MVDKISGNGSYEFPGSQKRKNPAVRAYENTPGSKEEARKGAAQAAKKRTPHTDTEDVGVVLDLSKNTGRKQAASAAQKKEVSLPNALRRLFSPVVEWLKAFWGPSRLEEAQADDEQQPVPEENMELSLSGEFDPDVSLTDAAAEAEIETEEKKAAAAQVLKSGDLSQVERFLTDNGTKRLAHNSDLLTYYDRRGKFVEMDETEKHRVLFGDKNVLKL